VPTVDLMHDAPQFEPRAAAYLLAALAGAERPDSLAEAIYVDAYGNVMTGLPAGKLSRETCLTVGDARLHRAETFGAVAPGEAFWYENSCGLAEIAVNRGSAAESLGLGIGSPIGVTGP
jgi:S-adenosylmethionine hydrolase